MRKLGVYIDTVQCDIWAGERRQSHEHGTCDAAIIEVICIRFCWGKCPSCWSLD